MATALPDYENETIISNVSSKNSSVLTTSNNGNNDNVDIDLKEINSKVSKKQMSEQWKKFYCLKDGRYNLAKENCEKKLINEKLDGTVIDFWLLTEIDHWDNEFERLVILTENSILICRYNFVSDETLSCRRIPLVTITSLNKGLLVYPIKSLMTPRNYDGLKIILGKENKPVSFLHKWNPLFKSLPYVILASHALIACDSKQLTLDKNIFYIENFMDCLVKHIKKGIQGEIERNGKHIMVENAEILIESYASLPAMVFNQSFLGFSLERGGVSF